MIIGQEGTDMDVNEDITILLEEVSVSLQKIEMAYIEALTDEQKISVSKPLIKNSMENLRSVLDYAAQDVSSYIGNGKGVYFPYANVEALFTKSVKKNLRGIKDKAPRLFKCIEGIQSFKCGDDWLFRLCSQVNIDKHNNLSGQLRINSPAYRTILGQIADLGTNCSITFKDCMFDDVRVGWEHPITIDWDTPREEINHLLGAISMESSRRYEWVEFHFEETTDDVFKFIKNSHRELSMFIPRLYALMK